MPRSLLGRQPRQLSHSTVGSRGRDGLGGKERRWVSLVPLHLAGSQASLACSSWGFGNTTPIIANTLPVATLLSHDLLGPGNSLSFWGHSTSSGSPHSPTHFSVGNCVPLTQSVLHQSPISPSPVRKHLCSQCSASSLSCPQLYPGCLRDLLPSHPGPP